MKNQAPTPQLYLAGVFDVVGLSNIFQSFNGLPEKSEDASPLDGALKETLTFLKWFRWTLIKRFEHYPFEKNRLAPYEEDLHRIETLLGEAEVKVQTFADLIVPFAALDDAGNHLSALSTIMRMFHSAGSLFVISMASGRAIRGGIDAESAVERSSDEIYGRALNEALALAMRRAQYPRIAIGNHLKAYLKKITQLPERSVFVDHAKQLAAQCLNLIIEDTDGQLMLHYLSPDFKPPLLESSSFVEARAFIDQQPMIWHSAGHPHLVEKYQRLQEYWQTYGGHRTVR